MQKIAFHGVPRSGTTWVGAILDSSHNVAYRFQPLFSYAFKSFLSEKSSVKEINDFFIKIEKTNDNFVLQKEEKKRKFIPSFNKTEITHIIYKEVRYHNILERLLEKDLKIKVIGIIRNPKSVLSSWYNAPKEFKKNEWSFINEWKNAELKNQNKKEEFFGYNKWKEVSLLFLKLKDKYPDRFFLINYHELLTKTTETTKKIFDFCELRFSKQTIDFLAESQNKEVLDSYSVFREKQVDDKWKKRLPQEVINEIDIDLSDTALSNFLI